MISNKLHHAQQKKCCVCIFYIIHNLAGKKEHSLFLSKLLFI